MMFWKKKKTYLDDELGELVFDCGWGSSPIISSVGDIIVTIEGDKSGPNSISLQQAKRLLENIQTELDVAKAFINEKDISDFMEGNGSLIFDGFYSGEELGLYDLQFGLSKWDDASIVVHFKDNQAYEISLGD